MSVLESIKNKPAGFTTPPEYFTGFNEKLLERIKSEEEVPIKKLPVLRYSLAIAASIALLVTIWQITSFIMKKPAITEKPVITAEVKLKLQEIDEIFNNSIADLDESQIKEAISSEEKNNLTKEINKTEIMDYLSDENVDISDL